MNNEILDRLEDTIQSNNKWYFKIGLTSLLTIIIYFLFEYLRNELLENLYKNEQTQIKTIGLFILIITIVNSILIPTFLDKIRPKIGLAKTVLFTGIILLVIEIIFKLSQKIIIGNDLTISSFIPFLTNAIFLSIIGSSIANIRLHKLNGKKLNTPIILMILLWLSISYITRLIET